MAKSDINLQSAFYMEPEEIVKYFESKKCKISFDWHEVYEDAHAKAFTVAKMTNADLLKDTHDMLTKAIKEGWSSSHFKREAGELFAKKGWTGHKEVTNPKTGETQTVELGTPRRIKQIFNCNMRSAYAVGRYKQQLEDVDFAPYFQYQCILDGKTRPEHKAMHGKVFRYDDEIWQSLYPPNGWNCRCFVRSLTERQMERKGLKCESSDGKLKEIETLVGGEPKTITAYDFKANGKSFRMSADAGWGTNLGMFDYIPNLEKYDNEIAGQIAKTLTKSKVFDNYYNKCQSLAAKIEAKAIKNLSKNNLPTNRGNIEKYAINEVLRKKYSRPLKELSFDIAVLTKEQQKLLKTTKKTVKLSVETLIKEQIKHNDISIADFKAIPDIVTNANILVLKNKLQRLIYYKYNDKFISLVLKSTKNKNENYILTYHYVSKNDILKQLKDLDTTVIFNNLNIKKE